MNKQKLTYLSPETETLVVRFEESVLQGGSPGQRGAAGNVFDGSNTNDYEDDVL